MSKTQSKTLAGEVGKRQPFDSLRQEAYLNLVRTHTQLAGQLSRLFKQHGLTDPKYNALRILRGEGKPMQVYQIAERMVTPQTDVTRLVYRLEEAGLVERERCGEDRRVVWVTLTRRGKDVLKKLDQPVADLHESQFAGLTKTELKQLNDLLFRSRQN
ncbi:MarR family winged helix-turn-helix transcriptional regulator [Crateriforma spongiae]|uniref:MarR family winged helix-turn-helix transcriptional regulator n=1 Tax=Crateriforma spongiae TaxID=2724528 RepID=UPI0014476991|nr:MarR family transcriptional regulator [Crateriforma spongiae]